MKICSSINSIQENSIIDLVSLYPDPATSLLNIELLENVEIEIVNSFVLHSKKLQLTKGENSIDISDFANCVYFIYTPMNQIVRFIKD